MRQRVITVPKDKEAEQALDYNEAKPTQLIELILKDEEFIFLCDNGFPFSFFVRNETHGLFQRIPKACI